MPDQPHEHGMREALKAIARGAATVLISPMLLSYHLRATILGPDRALEGSTQALARVPGILGQYTRRAFLCRTLAQCAASATVEYGTIFSSASARLGEHVYIGPYCCIGLAHLERDVLVAAGVHVPSGGRMHSFDDVSRPIREQGGERRVVRIGAGSWIGSASVVLADVGRDTVVGAGSVVSKPLPDGVVAAGVPAVVIRQRIPGSEVDAAPAHGR